MDPHDQLYRLYEEFDTHTARTLQNFVDVFPPVDSRVALEYWEDATDELDDRKSAIREGFPTDGGVLADVATHATREQAFVGLDLLATYGRAVNVLVLDVDETLRSAGSTDNEIPRDTLHLLTEFHEEGVPIVVCTGQTLENVKGFAIQGLGNELVHSGDLSIVYETGTGVFTPGHGPETKRLLYLDLDAEIRRIFDRMRSRILPAAPEQIREGCHLQGNEFNVTLKPNFETGRPESREVIELALSYMLELLAEVVMAVGADAEAGVDTPEEARGDPDGTGAGPDASGNPDGTGFGSGSIRDAPGDPADWTRAYYAARDPEIRAVLVARDELPDVDPGAIPSPFRGILERIDVAYYEADAAEVGSLELNKVVGVEAALDVLGVEDPFVLVMGDSKTDLRVMEWAAENDAGIAAAPDHASEAVLDHVRRRDGLVFDRGDAAAPLRVVYALNSLAGTTR